MHRAQFKERKIAEGLMQMTEAIDRLAISGCVYWIERKLRKLNILLLRQH